MATSTITSPTAAPFSLESTRTRIGEKVIVAWLFFASTIAVLITIGIVISIILPTIEFFQLVPLTQFFSFKPWAPLFADPTYGVVYIVAGTAAIVIYSGIVGLPAGLGAAIYMSEYASPRARKILQPVLEILEGIPTVVYGIFALFFVGPIIKDNWPTWIPGKLGEEPGFQFLLAAGLVLGVMLIPTVASVAYDSMNAVPRALREAAYGLGGTRMQVATRVVVPSALSGIIASFVLGLSRAVGETIVVLMAAGAMANLTLWPNDAILTMTAFIGRTATGDISTGSVAYFTVFAVGALLFAITLTVNLIAIALVRRFREAYE